MGARLISPDGQVFELTDDLYQTLQDLIDNEVYDTDLYRKFIKKLQTELKPLQQHKHTSSGNYKKWGAKKAEPVTTPAPKTSQDVIDSLYGKYADGTSMLDFYFAEKAKERELEDTKYDRSLKD